MPVSTNNTTITFNDATTQTTAPTISSATAVASTGISVTAITTTGAATHTITNTGVTSIVAGTGISISGATGAVTVTNANPGGGGVTSAVSGNGVAVSASTGAVTFSASCPGFNTVGSYCLGVSNITTPISSGGTLAAGGGSNQLYSAAITQFGCCTPPLVLTGVNNLSGTWRLMGASMAGSGNGVSVFCRVS